MDTVDFKKALDPPVVAVVAGTVGGTKLSDMAIAAGKLDERLTPQNLTIFVNSTKAVVGVMGMLVVSRFL